MPGQMNAARPYRSSIAKTCFDDHDDGNATDYVPDDGYGDDADVDDDGDADPAVWLVSLPPARCLIFCLRFTPKPSILSPKPKSVLGLGFREGRGISILSPQQFQGAAR